MVAGSLYDNYFGIKVRVFCKCFFPKIANRFSPLLQVHFPHYCKLPIPYNGLTKSIADTLPQKKSYSVLKASQSII